MIAHHSRRSSRLFLIVCVIALWFIASSPTVHAQITFVDSSASEGFDDRGTSVVPATVQVGDLLLAQVTIRNIGGSDAVFTPAGWTLLAPQDNSDDVFQSIYYRVATAGDPGTGYEWDFAGNGNRRFIIGMSAFRGVDTTDPIDAENSQTGVFGTSPVAPSVTTTRPNAMLVAFYTIEAGNQSYTPAAGMTEIYDEEENNTNNGVTTMAAYQEQASVGLTGNKVAGVTRLDDNIGHLVALNDNNSVEIQSLTGSCSPTNEMTLVFSSDVTQASAENIANYSLANPASANIALASAVQISPNTVIITAAGSLNDLTQYTLTVNNVTGTNGSVIAPNTSETFGLSCGINCITDSFNGVLDNSQWAVSNSSGSFGDPRVVVNGRLRLTDNSQRVATVANLLNQFPGADNRIEVEFDYYAYNGGGADGVGVVFSDASITPVAGARGGSLGYAQLNAFGLSINGFAGGWIGIGLDEFGNYSDDNEGKIGGPGFRPDSVAVRGSGSGLTGYPYLAGSGSLFPGVDQSGSAAGPGDRYRIVIDHTAGGGQAFVSVERDTGGGYTDVVPTFNVFAANAGQAAVPENWVLSFTGSTGGITNIHAIGNLRVCAAQPIEGFSFVDHYEISHSNTGVTCEASEITVTAHDDSHNPITVNSDTVLTISTNPAVDNIIPSTVTIPDGQSSVTFNINQTTPLANIDIDVTDGTATDDDGSAEDPPISFVDTAFRFYANGSNTDTIPIGVQISGKNSNVAPGNQSLELAAVRTNTDTGACENVLNGVQTVGFAYECENPVACSSSDRLDITGSGATTTVSRNNNGSVSSYIDVQLDFGNDGRAPFILNYRDAGQIQLFARKNIAASSPDPAFTLSGSSNSFVVRPFGFDVDFSGARNADYADDGTLNGSAGNTSYAADQNGSRFITAGTSFPVTTRAVLWSGTDDSNNDGVPDSGANLTDNGVTPAFGQETGAQTFSLTQALVLPAGGDVGIFSSSGLDAGGSPTDFVSGVATGSASWDEVGIINITAGLTDYLGNASADATGTAGNVGRFYPASFALQSSGATESCSNVFTYMSDPGLELEYTVRAREAGGSITLNYEGVFASATLGMVAENNNDGGDYGSRLSGFTSPAWSAGEYVFSSFGEFERNAAPDGPFSDLTIGITLSDPDGSLLTGLDMRADATTDCTTAGDCNAREIVSIDARYGDLHLNNAFGSETENLETLIRARYFDGSQFIINTDDSCTLIQVSDPPLVPLTFTGNLDAGEAPPSLVSGMISGEAVIRFDAPGVGNSGSVEYEYQPPAWLTTENDGDGDYNDNPRGTITFGQFRGTDRVIYWREIVR